MNVNVKHNGNESLNCADHFIKSNWRNIYSVIKIKQKKIFIVSIRTMSFFMRLDTNPEDERKKNYSAFWLCVESCAFFFCFKFDLQKTSCARIYIFQSSYKIERRKKNREKHSRTFDARVVFACLLKTRTHILYLLFVHTFNVD